MVWGLFPIDPLPGEQEYYIFRKGTYKVGRKGCDIIINKDKGVSRVHAEIIVDEMICMDYSNNSHSSSSSNVRIRDCSKYGTFVNKDMGPKEKVHEYPNKETMLKEGQLIAFGTGNAKYRFSFVPLMLFASSFKPSVLNQLQEKILLIGAYFAQTWSSNCTHMVSDDSISINDDIIEAIVARKPIVGFSWIELISGRPIWTEVPSTLSHAPTLQFDGVSFKIADPQSREQCLNGYTFLLESVHKYKFKEKLQFLLEVSGAKVVYVKALDTRSQNLGDNEVCVVPAGLTSSSGIFKEYISQRNLNEMELVTAVVSGHLDPSIIKSAPVMITSSCSTDETVVADSDAEMETATSVRASVVANLMESAENEKAEPSRCFQTQNTVRLVDSSSQDNDSGRIIASPIKTEHGSQGFLAPNQETSKPDRENISLSKDRDRMSESENPDIIYCQNLIVRDSILTQSGCSSRNGAAVDFKRFRKTSAPSGNSFSNLIPFSNQAYEESDYGNEDVSASIKEEKKRKQMEAIAEDLFNTEKKGKRGASSTLRGLFARG